MNVRINNYRGSLAVAMFQNGNAVVMLPGTLESNMTQRT